MPIYEYRCADCEHIFEEIQQFSDPDPETCPSCDAGEVARLVSRSNFQLRGGGWYADEYSSTSTVNTDGDAPNTATASDDAAGNADKTSTKSAKSDSGTSDSSKKSEAAAAE